MEILISITVHESIRTLTLQKFEKNTLESKRDAAGGLPSGQIHNPGRSVQV